MTSPRTIRFIATATLAVVAGVAALPAFAQGKADVFKIGVVLPKTGAYSQYGDFIEQGMQVGVEEVNAMGGILGRRVELVVRDDASNPGRALLATKSLLSEEKVDALYPEVISGLALAVVPYTTDQKIFTISNGAAPQIGDSAKLPYSFQFSDLASQRAPAMAAAVRKLGGKKVGILVSTNPPQVALGDALNADLKPKYGLEVAGYQKYGIDSKDYTPQLQALKDAGADIVAFDSTSREGVRNVMTSMQTLGWTVKLVGLPAMLYGDLTDQIPESVQKQFYAVNYRVGTRTAAGLSPELTRFLTAMKKIRPVSNLALGAIARDTVFLFKWSFETAQKDAGNTSADSVRKALESIATKSLPKGYALVFENPRYTATEHTTNNADYSRFWGLVHASKLVDGTYEGENLEVKF